MRDWQYLRRALPNNVMLARVERMNQKQREYVLLSYFVKGKIFCLWKGPVNYFICASLKYQYVPLVDLASLSSLVQA